MAAAAAASPAQPTGIIILSANVLAPCWIKPKWFPGIPQSALDAKARVQANIKAILSSGPDVVCLQEVDADTYPILMEALASAGYPSTKLSPNKPTSAKRADGSEIANGTLLAFNIMNRKEQAGVETALIHDMGVSICRIEGYPVILNVHLDRQDDGGDKALKALREFIAKRNWKEGCVVIGDFNVKQEDLKAVFNATGESTMTPRGSMCFCAGQPAMVLDHVAMYGNAKVEAVEPPDQPWRDEVTAMSHKKDATAKEHAAALTKALESYGSDHLPIRVRLLRAA
jgi:endonuclease/exonuclease/phosphatase family metal-dependent hydrolase